MKSFLRQVADYYYNIPHLQDYCFVFPNRRSGQFFAKELTQLLDRTCMLPRVTTFNDWLSGFDSRATVSPVEATFVLYDAYHDIFGDKASSIDRFVFWANIVLSDFNDIDMALADPERLYSNLSNLRDVSTDYIDENLKREIARIFGIEPTSGGDRFWKRDNYEDDEAIDKYFTLWEALGKIYKLFHEKLTERGLATMGRICRDMSSRMERIAANELDCERVVMVGFVSLTASEDAIFKALKEKGVADFWWDDVAPAFDLTDNKGGQLVRMFSKRYPSPVALEPLQPMTDSLKVDVVGVPSAIGQAKWAFHTIGQMALPADEREKEFRDLPLINGEDALNTAIVLPEESLFVPLINSVHPKVGLMNVTMGYPMRQAGITSLMHLVARAHRRATHDLSDNRWLFYREDVLDILSHPIVKSAYTVDVLRLMNDIELSNEFNVPESLFRDTNLMPLFEIARDLRDKSQVLAFLDRLRAFASDLNERLADRSLTEHHDEEDEEGSESIMPLQCVFVEHYVDALEQLRDRIEFSEHNPVEDDALFFLLDRLTSGHTVPFAGEPLAGLQVMGMLETRCLDFDNVIILSMNERVFPSRRPISTLIPDMLRNAFYLRNNQTVEAVTTYHFYRLLSRSSHVTMVYNTSTQGGTPSEPSRFVAQLEKIYDVRLRQMYADTKVQTVPELSIKVPKTHSKEILLRYLSPSDDAKRLSASAINEYVNCPLMFYFNRIQGLNTENQTSDFMDSGTLGTIVHDTLQELYYPDCLKAESKPNFVTSAKIESFKEKLDKIIVRQVNKTYKHKDDAHLDDPLQGDAYMLEDTIADFVRNVLDYDLKLLAEKGGDIEVLECEIDHPMVLDINGQKVNFTFKADRVDRVGNVLRIVDYKTGTDKTKFDSIEQLFDNTNDKRPKAILQLMLYCNAWYQLHPEHTQIQPMIYKVGKMSDSGVKYNKTPYLFTPDNELNLAYLSKLKETLGSLFDESEPFVQAESEKNCEYCAFADFCRRR